MKAPTELHHLKAMHQVMRDGRLTPPKLNHLVEQRLRRVLVSAYQHVPYYRDVMQAAGYDPARDYRGPADLSRLPLTSKRCLHRGSPPILVKEGTDLDSCIMGRTSGSTGIPVRIYHDRYEQSVKIAKWLRVLFRNGYSLRDRVMFFAGPSHMAGTRSPLQRLGILRNLPIDVTQTSYARAVDWFVAHKPEVLYGNRSRLELMALEMNRRGQRAEHLKLLVVTGEVIDKTVRRLLRNTFGLEPVESYGSVEMGVMAYETPARDGLHLCEDLTYFEFLDEDGMPVPPGVRGRVVVTDLAGFLMPLIRYDQGDYVIYEELPATDNGRPVRRIKHIMGRDSDFALLPDGSYRTDGDFAIVIGECTDVLQYRIMQRTRDFIEILVVVEPKRFADARSFLLERLRAKFPEVRFDITRVERMEPDSSGKLKKLVSEVHA